MNFIRAAVLPDVCRIEIEPNDDNRGFFTRTFCEREFAANALNTSFPQHSLSHTLHAGTIRGMHYRVSPNEEIKLVRCTRGAIFDVVVDVRPGSATFAKWEAFELTAENHSQLYIPAGFAHGFQTLCADVEVSYLISEFYGESGNSGFRYDDPLIGISWPAPVSIVSSKDLDWPPLLT